MTLTVKDAAVTLDSFEIVWRQVVEGMDGARLLPARDKRVRDLTKRLDKPTDKNGWRMFVSGCVHTMQNGAAKQKRNSEIALIEAVARWRGQVLELLPDREEDLKRIVREGVARPEPPPTRK